MLFKFKNLLCLCLVGMIASAPAMAQAAIPAFPGAEGYGAATDGGRGGRVMIVTNLNDAGPGSLREACEAEGPRIVVFDVAGTIMLERQLSIKQPHITIAGQSAPGDGVCIGGESLSIGAGDVVIRYIRARFGDVSGRDSDAIGGRGHRNIILDHISASWSVDETLSIYNCENVTIQWCMVTESLYEGGHKKGAHGFGGIWGSNYSTYHHNLLAHHSSRNPRFASNCGFNDFRNNVLYNWGYNSSYGGEDDRKTGTDRTVFNIVANYYKPGPATEPGDVARRIANPSSHFGLDGFARWHVAGNVVEGDAAVTADNWDGGVQPSGGAEALEAVRMTEPWDAMPIHQQSAREAYALVLGGAGACLPVRDAVDTRIIEEVRGGYATCEGAGYRKNGRNLADPAHKTGIIDSQADVGGWPELKTAPAAPDADRDGMPDAWERMSGLNPGDNDDAALDPDKDGYTNIEEFLNGTDPGEYIDYTKPENNVNTLQ